jgi:methionine biosynthesis protein MetW
LNSRYDIDPESIVPGTSHHFVLELAGAPSTLLDVGCSSGGLAAAFAAKGARVFGIEIDDEARAKAESRGIECVPADLDHDDLAGVVGDRRFDVVVFADVLEHLRDPHKVLAAAADVLAPGGAVVVSVPNVAHGAVRIALMRGRWDLQTYGLLDSTHLRFFTLDGLRDLAAESGYLLKEIRRTILPLPLAYGEAKWGFEHDREREWMVRALDNQAEIETHQFVVLLEPMVSAEGSRENLLSAARAAQIELRQALAELEDLRNEVGALRAREAAVQEAQLRILEQRDYVIGLEALTQRLVGDIAALQAGMSWRLGRALTRPIRSLRRIRST